MIPDIKTTMSSREIAELTDKEHRHVLRDCDVLNENYEKLSLPKIGQGYYTHPNTGTQQHREYLLTRMQTFDLMTGYNTELRIKVNRRWEELEKKNALDFNNPDTVLKLTQNWRDETLKRIEAEKVISKLSPKAQLMDQVLDTDLKIDIGQAAKILGLSFGRNALFAELRERHIFFCNRNEPKQTYVERGYFELKEKFIERNDSPGFAVIKVLVTQKGLDFLAKKFCVIRKPIQLSIIQ